MSNYLFRSILTKRNNDARKCIYFLCILLGAIVIAPHVASSQEKPVRCAIIEFLDQASSHEDITAYTTTQDCHVNELYSALAFTQSQKLFLSIQLNDVQTSVVTDFVNVKRAIFVLEQAAGIKTPLALLPATSLLTASLVAESEMSDQEARNIRFFSAALIEDLKRQLNHPINETTMGVMISTYANGSLSAANEIQNIVPYCALYAMEHDQNIMSAITGSIYHECISRKDIEWATIAKLLTSS